MKIINQNLPKCENCVIRNASLFGELETMHLDQARALRSSQVVFNAGEHLYHEGDTPDKAFTLYNGWVSLYKNLEDGSRQILRFALPGDLLCYKTKFNTPLDHSAIALTDTTLCAFPLTRFSEVISELPELSFALSSVSEVTTKRCYGTLTAIASFAAEAKVAYLVLSLFIRELSIKKDAVESIHFPITQEDIADALGLTAIHVNRVIQSLKKRGLIHYENKQIWVPDQEALAEVARTDLDELKMLMVII